MRQTAPTAGVGLQEGELMSSLQDTSLDPKKLSPELPLAAGVGIRSTLKSLLVLG